MFPTLLDQSAWWVKLASLNYGDFTLWILGACIPTKTGYEQHTRNLKQSMI